MMLRTMSDAIHVDIWSLSQYLQFSDVHYTRNLNFRNDLFELPALCWQPGQKSWIHNHQGQHCWMAIAQGTLGVRNYKRTGCDQQDRTVQMQSLASGHDVPISNEGFPAAGTVHEVNAIPIDLPCSLTLRQISTTC